MSKDIDIDSYDWLEVIGWSEPRSNPDPYTEVLPNSTMEVSNLSLTGDMVAEVVMSSEGDNDGPDWLIVIRLNDGRYIFASGWCDYTGWDCQSGVRRFVADDLEILKRFAISPGEWERMESEE